MAIEQRRRRRAVFKKGRSHSHRMKPGNAYRLPKALRRNARARIHHSPAV